MLGIHASFLDAKADTRGGDDVEPVDLRERGVHVRLNSQVRHDDERHGRLLWSVVAGVVLDHARDADPVVSEYASRACRSRQVGPRS